MNYQLNFSEMVKNYGFLEHRKYSSTEKMVSGLLKKFLEEDKVYVKDSEDRLLK